ncbi:MAG: hypothetical protein ACR2HX_11860 [Pyrinomonadaceae bacterium]
MGTKMKGCGNNERESTQASGEFRNSFLEADWKTHSSAGTKVAERSGGFLWN